MKRLCRYYQNFSSSKNEPITINEFSLRVGDRLYPFDGISNYTVKTIAPNRIPAVLVIPAGTAIFALGILHTGGELFQLFGIVLILLGMLNLIYSRKYYVLRIVMNGTEEMDVLALREKSQMAPLLKELNRKLNRSLTKSDAASMPHKWIISYT